MSIMSKQFRSSLEEWISIECGWTLQTASRYYLPIFEDFVICHKELNQYRF